MMFRVLFVFLLMVCYQLSSREIPKTINPKVVTEAQGRDVRLNIPGELRYYQINGYAGVRQVGDVNLIKVVNTAKNTIEYFDLPSAYVVFNAMSFNNSQTRVFVGGGTDMVPITVLNKANFKELYTIPNSIYLEDLIPIGDDEVIGKPYSYATGMPIKKFKGQTLIAELPSSGQYYAWTSINASPNQQTLVATSTDETVTFWDLKTYQILRLKGHGSRVRSAQFSHDGNFVVSVSEDGGLIIWDAQSKTIRKIFSIKLNTFGYGAVACTPDNKYVAVGDYWWGTIALIDVATGKVYATIPSKYGRGVKSLQFNAQGNRLLARHEGEFIIEWDLSGSF